MRKWKQDIQNLYYNLKKITLRESRKTKKLMIISRNLKQNWYIVKKNRLWQKKKKNNLNINWKSYNMRLKTFNHNYINLKNKDYNYYKNYNNINKILKKLNKKNKTSFNKIHKQILNLKLLIHQKKENSKILLVTKNLCRIYNKKLNY